MNALARAAAMSLALLSPAIAKTERDPAQVKAFRKENPCPSNGQRYGRCPGWIVDHLSSLACGGPDLPSNMIWQREADAKRKDRWERIGCRNGRIDMQDFYKSLQRSGKLHDQ